MPQTFYIEPDEEIISVIGRLRKSGSERNFFVFPKRALVLQSIINLRLFQREAQKLGKRVVIVTQDEAGKMLAEKAGMETEHYSEDFSRERSHVELVAQSQQVPVARDVDFVSATGSERIMPHSDTIGSSDFHSRQSGSVVPSESSRANNGTVQKLRIRNASPERPPSLNSVRQTEEVLRARAAAEAATARRMQDIPPVRQAMSPVPAPSLSIGNVSNTPREERLRNFFSDRETQPRKAPMIPDETSYRTPSSSEHVPKMGKKAGVIFAFFGVVAVISLIGVGGMLFLPKAVVHVTPHKTVQNTDVQFDARGEESVPSSEESVSARVVEKEESISISVATSGTSGSSNQKARGTVVIYNAFNKESQPLIATTRLETSDGKVYRLTESVIVPGMTDIGGKSTPGAIEASVVADQAGSEYNIDASEFSIPGFKGSPKYAKFSAKSTKSFVGGSTTGSGMATIAKADIDKAEKDVKEQAKNAFVEEVKKSLASDEKILEESIEVVSQPVTLPQVGTAASSFDYQSTLKVRAFVFSEAEIRSKIEQGAATDIQGISFHPVSVTLAYGESLPDYDRHSVRIRAHALVTLESDVDQEKLRSALAGQDESGIEKVLETFPGIKKIRVDFSPEWFVSSIPESTDRVSIAVDPGEE